ncbi:MAG: hypothetical protein CVU95_04025 [Firmicutes bacterium HGW-Firmicutes-2]|nr:MAG: hypothetical protein CVU95_04025 [Firmicutes bacterium HGW-Firmicutes-2]
MDHIKEIKQDENRILVRELELRNITLYGKFCDFYSKMKSEVYPFIRDKNQWYNDHGEIHVEAIIKTISDMIRGYCIEVSSSKDTEIRDIDTEYLLSTYDLFSLLISIVIHDAYMIQGRKKHGANVVNIFSKLNNCIEDEELSSSIIKIARAHSDKMHFHKCKNLVKINDFIIQEKSLASLLRFADEISEDKNRGIIGNDLFEKEIVGTDHEIYWRHTHAIQSSIYNSGRRSIDIYYRINKEFAFVDFKLDTDETITLFEFIVNRINKVNDERILCAPFFSQYCIIDSLYITLEFYEQNDDGFRETLFSEEIEVCSYPNSGTSIEEFLNAFPKFKIKYIKDRI